MLETCCAENNVLETLCWKHCAGNIVLENAVLKTMCWKHCAGSIVLETCCAGDMLCLKRYAGDTLCWKHVVLERCCGTNSSPDSVHGSVSGHPVIMLFPARPEHAIVSKAAADPSISERSILVKCRRQGERAEQLRLGITTRGDAGRWDQDDRQRGGGGGHRPASCSPASRQAAGCQPLQGRQGPRHLQPLFQVSTLFCIAARSEQALLKFLLKHLQPLHQVIILQSCTN